MYSNNFYSLLKDQIQSATGVLLNDLPLELPGELNNISDSFDSLDPLENNGEEGMECNSIDKEEGAGPVNTNANVCNASSILATPVMMLRLPSPCPIPTVFTSDITNAIEQNRLKGLMKYRLLRQCALFYWGVCPRPTPDEYKTIAITLCLKFPQLKDKKPKDGKYWV